MGEPVSWIEYTTSNMIFWSVYCRVLVPQTQVYYLMFCPEHGLKQTGKWNFVYQDIDVAYLTTHVIL